MTLLATRDRPKPRWRRMIGFLLLILVVPYLALLIFLYTAQTRMIFPGQSTQGLSTSQVEPPPGTRLASVTGKRGDRIAVFFAPASETGQTGVSEGKKRPTVLYFYGNGMSLASSMNAVDRLRKLGCNVVAVDYPGYGMSGGTASEAGCYESADVAYDYAVEQPEVDRTRIVPVGFSLGAAVAVDLASRRPVSGLMTSCAFTSMTDMVRSRFPFVPPFLLRHKFANLDKIATIKVPILIGHGKRDGIVPVAMADLLASAAGGPVSRIILPEADHTDITGAASFDQMREIRRFLAEVPPVP